MSVVCERLNALPSSTWSPMILRVGLELSHWLIPSGPFWPLVALIAISVESLWASKLTPFSRKIFKDFFLQQHLKSSLYYWYGQFKPVNNIAGYFLVRCRESGGVVCGERSPVLEFRFLGKLRFWVVTFLSGTMKGKVIMFNRNAVFCRDPQFTSTGVSN